ncbi:response regulator transcription factor [Gorillibacterium sp. sgz5001074]|uniref:response regulator transcription factor n=1 Tax=Gorillibacterium sp. sgz5001074 TaxID=3446695 RepID=UPI003F66A4C7
MQQVSILVAEDEEDIRNLLNKELSEEGYTVYPAADGWEAHSLFLREKVDIGIFDSMMPRLDGVRLMQKIREQSDIPIIFLTARDLEMDKVLVLSLGADDYIVKPFSVAELKARIAVQVRKLTAIHSRQFDTAELQCGDIRVDPDQGCAYLGTQELKLSAKEYQLLQFFLENRNRLLTKKQLYHAVWKEEYAYDDNTVMVHISRLRNKIEENPKEPKHLVTFRGIGYKLIDGR